ncbi:hypothetical protein GGTG_12294 [Gaeumannomyces tritici R3-111a-1]|uniref:Uncharacterized protein n=1 Tax=Gaeumannomyces tritici (strain R3-111a-1) TaxID=644352 RepID=J3PFL9_GAET3|nr:hypothetical protein GGTG_12294 [Gaeumannomyces tritici R3-111a-1]EJT70121.1 hypothetical protein GGTG_12294 [Gaeumannomyces tritici R3-111a-1]
MISLAVIDLAAANPQRSLFKSASIGACLSLSCDALNVSVFPAGTTLCASGRTNFRREVDSVARNGARIIGKRRGERKSAGLCLAPLAQRNTALLHAT